MCTEGHHMNKQHECKNKIQATDYITIQATDYIMIQEVRGSHPRLRPWGVTLVDAS